MKTAFLVLRCKILRFLLLRTSFPVISLVSVSILWASAVWATTGKEFKTKKSQSEVRQLLTTFYTPSDGILEELFQGEVVSLGQVSSLPSSLKSPKPETKSALDLKKSSSFSNSSHSNKPQMDQSLFLFVAGIHPQKCSRAMRKLSLYENYHEFIDYIKESRYDQKKELLFFKIDHALLPSAMILHFQLPRITDEGRYEFVFKHGFLKNLKGDILLKNIKNHCLMALQTKWTGPETPIPNIVLSSFIQTIGKVGLEYMMRVSRF